MTRLPCDLKNDIDCYFNSYWKKQSRHNPSTHANTFTIHQKQINNELLEYIKSNQNPEISRFSRSYRYRKTEELMALIDKINAINETNALVNMMRYLQEIDVPTFYYLGIAPNYQAPKIYCLVIGEPAIDMSTVLAHQSGSPSIIRSTVTMLVHMHRFLAKYSIDVGPLTTWIYYCLTLNSSLAKLMKAVGDTNDPSKMYYSESTEAFFQNHHWVWRQLLDKHGSIICYNNPEQIQFLDSLFYTLSETRFIMIKYYLIFSVLDRYGPYTELREPSENLFFDTVSEYMSQELQNYYESEHANPIKNQQVRELFYHIRDQAIETFSKTDSFSSNDKQELLDKLNNMIVMVGVQGFSESKPQMTDSFYQNMFNVNKVAHLQRQLLYDKPVVRHWLSVETQIYSYNINAYYEPMLNLVYIPTAMISDNFYQLTHNDLVMAWNYGGIGTVVAHEITHSFDAFGRMFDSHGFIRHWMSEKGSESYDREIAKVKAHYERIRVFGEELEHETTLAEDMADIIGLQLSLRAYRKYYHLKRESFVWFMQGWAMIMRDNTDPKIIIKNLPLDVHSPGTVRINAPFPHLTEYYEFFDVIPSDLTYLAPHQRLALV